jgi:hypothetical protein
VKRVSIVSLIGLLLAAAAPAAATAQAPRDATPSVSIPTQDGPSAGRTVLGSAVGWAVGLGAGAALGYAVQPDPGESYFGAGEWWLGAWIGSSVGSAIGAHLGNGRQGNLPLVMLGSIAVGPAALIVAPALGPAGVFAIPAAQIGVSVAIERRSAAVRRGQN